MMTNPAMGYIGLAVEISLSITLKMTNKIIYKYLCIECMYQCFWDFRDHGFSCDIRRWKIKSNNIRLAVVYQSTLSKLIGWMIYDNQEIRRKKIVCPTKRNTNIRRIRLRFVRSWHFEIKRNLHIRFFGWWSKTLCDLNISK